jgi:RHS repeat-associated protein
MKQFFTHKYRFIFLILNLIGVSALAQKPTASKNYVIIKTYKIKSQDETITDPKKVDIDLNYTDGTGRTSQTIAIHASPTGKDMVMPHVYDSLGREAFQFLPFSYTTSQNNNGAFIANAAGIATDAQGKKTATGAISNFYNTAATVDYTKDTKPFSETQFETSAYSRVLKQESVGKNFEQKWANVDYRLNTSTDAIRRFKYTGKYADADQAVDLYKIEYDSTYKANQLTSVKTTDADGKSSIKFTDQEGRTVLVRSTTINGPLDTYYVYDDYGQSRGILPPKLSKYFTQTNATGVIQIDSLKRYAFLSMYDELGRQTVSKKPEIEPVFTVYDNWDRVVFTQDGNQRARLNASNQPAPVWAFAKYDVINRPAMTGEVPYSGTRLALQTNVNAVTNPANRYETINNSIYYTFNNSSPAGIVIDSTQILTVNYYDGVNYTVAAACPSGTAAFTSSTAYNYDASHVVSMPTGSRVRILGATTWTRSVVFYDYDYRPVQSISDVYGIANSPGATEVTTAEYNWQGEILRSDIEHKAITTNSPVRKVTKAFTYDHNHRLLNTKYRLGNLVSNNWVYNAWVTTGTYDYNELGQLKTKKLHEKPVQNTYGLSVAYLYNVQGSMTEVNAGTTKFYEKIFYEKQKDNSVGLFNGSIAEMYWKNGTRAEAGFKFTYDDINRLISTKGVAFTYEERGIKYDDNNNITRLSRLWNNVVVDSLVYTYRGNQLINVNDITNNATGFTNGTTISAGVKYAYDANGNMTRDGSKSIGTGTNPAIKYNILDLVQEVFVNAKTVKYTYSAAGEKLIRDVGTAEKNTYVGDFEYDKNGILTRIDLGDGQIVKDATTNRMHYQYYLQDHLGNVRVMIDSIGAIQQQTDYLAFGSVISYNNLAKNKYLYEGKEYQADANWMDFGARMYNPSIGRWFNADPMSQMASPYDYNGGDPINRIDPDGRFFKELAEVVVRGMGPVTRTAISVAGFGASMALSSALSPTDWYQNTTTGEFKHFKGSGKHEGFNRVGDDYYKVPEWGVIDPYKVVESEGGIKAILKEFSPTNTMDYPGFGVAIWAYNDKANHITRKEKNPNAYGGEDNVTRHSITGLEVGRYNRFPNEAVHPVDDIVTGAAGGVAGGLAKKGLSAAFRQVSAKGGWMSSSTILGADGATALNASRMVSEEGIHQVLLHGTGDGFFVDGVFTSSKDLARIMLQSGFQPGTPVRLISCHTGVFGDGAAYQLSRYLRSPVIAPTNKVRILQGGAYEIYGDGRFRTFFNTTIK